MNTATNSKARLEGILDQVRVLKAEHYEQAKITGENFNVFSFLSIEEKEKTHSDIIAELLNPHGSHSQGPLFLKLFLEQLKPTMDVSNEHTGFKVRTEVSFFNPATKEEGRPDIVIESVDAYIVIENKIETGDHEEQLKKYYNHIKDEKRDKTIKRLYYLTLNGDKPNNYSHPRSESEIGFYQLSYCEDIIKWLEACIKEVARIPQIRETLYQYQMIVKKLIGQPINRRYAMALKDILLEDKNYNLIPELDTAISEAKVDFQCDFWTKLKEKLKAQKELKDTRYEVYKGDLKIEEKAGPKECIDECASQGGLGLTSSFSEKGNYEIMFRIAHERYPLYYGFVLCEKGGRKKVAIDEAEQEHKEYLKRYSIADGKAHGQSGWLTYKSFNLKINFANFKFVTEHTEPNREALIERLVGVLVKEVCGVIEKISEQEQGSIT